MRLTGRDIEILKAVFSFGFLTCSQIASLFSINLKICQRRLRLLFKDDYLRSLPLPTIRAGRAPLLFHIGGEGETLLGVRASKPRLNRETTHAMKNTDIMIGIWIESRRAGLECELLPEHCIRVLEQRIIPDGAFCLKREDSQALFLIENCSGTEIVRSPTFNEDIESKIIRYVEMFERNEIEFYEEYYEAFLRRFRLLYITNNETRLRAISEVVAEHDIHAFIWMTTISELESRGVLGDIWHIPATSKFNVSIMG